jgi:hypothetical protein
MGTVNASAELERLHSYEQRPGRKPGLRERQHNAGLTGTVARSSGSPSGFNSDLGLFVIHTN